MWACVFTPIGVMGDEGKTLLDSCQGTKEHGSTLFELILKSFSPTWLS